MHTRLGMAKRRHTKNIKLLVKTREKSQKWCPRAQFVLTCRFLTRDVQWENQDAQEQSEKCSHVFKNSAVRWNYFLPRKVCLQSFSASFCSGFCSAFGSSVGFIIPPVVVDSDTPFSLSSLRVIDSLPAGSRGRNTFFHAE